MTRNGWEIDELNALTIFESCLFDTSAEHSALLMSQLQSSSGDIFFFVVQVLS